MSRAAPPIPASLARAQRRGVNNGFSVTLSMLGAPEAMALFDLLTPARQRSAVRQAVRKASAPQRKRMKQLAPKEHGVYRKAIGTKMRYYRSSGNIVAITGARTAHLRAGPRPSNLGSLLERGHSRGALPRPHAQPAFDETRRAAQDIFVREFAPQVRRAWEAQARRQAQKVAAQAQALARARASGRRAA